MQCFVDYWLCFRGGGFGGRGIILLSVPRVNVSEYPLGIFKLFSVVVLLLDCFLLGISNDKIIHCQISE